MPLRSQHPDTVGEGSSNPSHCPACGRKRLARTPNCVFCGARMPEPPRRNPTLGPAAALQPQKRGSSASPPFGKKADQPAAHGESDQPVPAAGPIPITGQPEEPWHQTNLYVNDERIDLRRCPWCDEFTHSLKAFDLPKFLIIPVHHFHYHLYETDPTEACPRCMRGFLIKFAACNLLTANVLWPVIVLPWYVYHFVLTFRKGHTPGAGGMHTGMKKRELQDLQRAD
jgi:hypothetical protein